MWTCDVLEVPIYWCFLAVLRNSVPSHVVAWALKASSVVRVGALQIEIIHLSLVHSQPRSSITEVPF